MIGENNILRLDAFSAYSIPDRKLYVYLKIACLFIVSKCKDGQRF